MTWKICLSDIDYGDDELQRVTDVLRSKWLTMGDVTREFEARFAEFLGVRQAVLVNNCTAALHLAHLAVGVGPGDEVICPSLTFVATANAALYCGATPVFADVAGPTDLNISPDSIRERITSNTKAITVVHYGGYAADMEAILEIGREYALPIIEDAAHAPGATWSGRCCGTIGDIGCFSFFSNKNLVCGEGGAVVTNDDGIADAVRLMRSHGMTALTYDRHRGRAQSYDVTRLGFNYRPTEITAALASAQLEKLVANNQRRRELTELYWQQLDTVPVTLPFRGRHGDSSCHLMPVLLPAGIDRSQVMAGLRDAGIQSSIHYPAVHQFSAFRHRSQAPLAWTEEAAERVLTLPLHPLLDDADIVTVSTALNDVLADLSHQSCPTAVNE